LAGFYQHPVRRKTARSLFRSTAAAALTHLGVGNASWRPSSRNNRPRATTFVCSRSPSSFWSVSMEANGMSGSPQLIELVCKRGRGALRLRPNVCSLLTSMVLFSVVLASRPAPNISDFGGVCILPDLPPALRCQNPPLQKIRGKRCGLAVVSAVCIDHSGPANHLMTILFFWSPTCRIAACSSAEFSASRS